jgi:hypothetical protein
VVGSILRCLNVSVKVAIRRIIFSKIQETKWYNRVMKRSSKSIHSLLPRSAAAVAVAIAIAGCAGVQGPDDGAAASAADKEKGQHAGFAQFSDIAVPPGAKMNVERTLVLGARDAWIGRLAVTTGMAATAAYDFVIREMPKFGWSEITSVRSGISVITYARGERVATVQIVARTLGGSQIDVTVSPRGRPDPPPVERMPAQ